jgi:acyl transferase domain-containing protein
MFSPPSTVDYLNKPSYSIGAISARSACRVAYYRGKLSSKLSGEDRSGGMIAVGLSEVDILPYLEAIKTQFGVVELSIACINSPLNVTVSGLKCHIQSLKLLLDQNKVFCRLLEVSVAYHSAMMIGIASEYHRLLENLEAGKPVETQVEMISSVTENPVSAEALQQGEYWVQNLVSQVRFNAALSSVCNRAEKARKKLDQSHKHATGVSHLLEIGPHSALQSPIRQILEATSKADKIEYSSVLIRRRPAVATTIKAVAELYCKGFPINLMNVNGISQRLQAATLITFPEYPFDHSKTYWHESRVSKGFRFRQYPKNPFLGAPVSDWNPLEARWQHFIKTSDLPWIEHHKVGSLHLAAVF